MRKPRSDGWYAGLGLDQLDAAFSWCSDVGYAQARERIKAELSRSPSIAALSNWYQTWPLQRAFQTAGSIAEQIKSALRDIPSLNLKPEQVDAMAQVAFKTVALQRMDLGAYAKIKVVEQRDAEQALDRERFQRETCELFIRWQEDQRARDIASSSGSNADKIAKLQALMFPE